jgi:pullulanase
MSILERDDAMNRHLRFSCLGAIVVIVPALCPIVASAENVTLRFEIEWPPDTPPQSVHWGLVAGTIEHAAGEIKVEGDSPTGKSRPAGQSGPIISEVALDLQSQGNDLEVYLCINADRFISFVPSFGDLFQRIKPIKTGDGWRVIAPKGGWTQRHTPQGDAPLTIHYHRFGEQYDNASLWTWDSKHQRQPEENELLPVGRDDFGLVFQLDTSEYGSESSGIGLLPRRNGDWQFKDGGDRVWTPSMGREVFIVQNDSAVNRKQPGLDATISRVTLDGPHRLTVRFSHQIRNGKWPKTRFMVLDAQKNLNPVSAAEADCAESTCKTMTLSSSKQMMLEFGPYTVLVDGAFTHNVEIDDFQKSADYYPSNELGPGLSYTKLASGFGLFSPTATAASVIIADNLSNDDGLVEYSMQPQGRGVWYQNVLGDLAGKYYAFKVAGWGLDESQEITDPYAKCTQARHTRTLIRDPGYAERTELQIDHQSSAFPESNAIIYEMHVRDFTIDPNSSVDARGKYLGLTESGTGLAGHTQISTGLDHLVELGVTHVQIMPIQDFDNDEFDDDAYNWGYMPVHFNSPDGSYASDPMGDAKIREVQQMVNALHARGIRVILDVVYNHTSSKASFDQIAPRYYYRINDDGSYSNGSGCGNEFDSESPIGRRFIVDSCEYWTQYYGFDGFRFDLMGLIDLETMRKVKNQVESLNPAGLVYGEPWTGGATTLDSVTDKHRVAGTGIGAFNDHFRDAIKGDRDGGGPGFIQTGDRVDGVIKGLAGSIDDWAKNPVDSINYFAAHDNLTAWDKILQSTPNAADAERRGMMRFAALILFTSQGHVFMHSGQEMCRTKQGHHNSYNQRDSINMIDWRRKKQYADVFEYNRGMIAIRKAHPAFQLKTADEVRKRVRISKAPADRCIVYRIDGRGLDGEAAQDVLVLLNGESKKTEFKLPPGKWTVHADADRASDEPMRTESSKVQLPAHSGMLLMR